MKKIISIISALALCAALTACNKTKTLNDFSGIKVVKRGGYGDRPVYFDLDKLEKACDIAVIGTFNRDTAQDVKYEYEEAFKKDIIVEFSSFNTITVDQVIKGDVEVGDELEIGQDYAIVDGDLITGSCLTPMIKGDTWLFFLSTANDCGFYWCEGDSDGRYPVSTVQNQTLAISEYSELGVFNRDNFNGEIYSEIVEKYGI